MSSTNANLIRGLYDALGRRDGDTMAAAYAAHARFRDPAFGELTGKEAGEMWRMLASSARDLEVDLVEHEAEGDRGRAHWIARYTFSPTGRRVTNDIRATFRFEDGRIVEHVDRFSFWRWSRQALGPLGLAVGWMPPFQAAFRRRARRNLGRFARRA